MPLDFILANSTAKIGLQITEESQFPISKLRVTSFGVCSICKIRKKVANTHTHNNTGREGETVTFMHTFTHLRVEAPIYLMTMQTCGSMLLVSERSSSLVLVHLLYKAPIYLMTMQTFGNMLLVSERSSSLVLVHLLYTVQVRVPLNSLLCVNVQKFCVRCELALT